MDPLEQILERLVLSRLEAPQRDVPQGWILDLWNKSGRGKDLLCQPDQVRQLDPDAMASSVGNWLDLLEQIRGWF